MSLQNRRPYLCRHLYPTFPRFLLADIYGGRGYVGMGHVTAIYWIFSNTSSLSVMNGNLTEKILFVSEMSSSLLREALRYMRDDVM